MHLSTENSAGNLQRVQIFSKPFIGEMFTNKKHPIHQNSSAMVINMDFLCQFSTSELMLTMKDLGHTTDLYRSLVIRCLVVKIEHLLLLSP